MRNLFQSDLELSLPPLRKWQERTVEEIRQAAKDGHKRIVVMSPTGAGKTLLAAHLFANSIQKGKRPMFTVPDITLVEQTVKSFERVGIHDIGVIQAQHERTDWAAQVQVASVQTLIRRALPEVDFVMVDECFPAGTMITTTRGSKPIEKINPGDVVPNAVGIGRVLSLYKSGHLQFVKVRFSNGKCFQCTPDHPIFTLSGWKKAGELEVREGVFREEDLCRLRWGIQARVQQKRSKCRIPGIGAIIQRAEMLQHILLEEATEPDAQSRRSGTGIRGSSRDGAYPKAGRQRQATASDSARSPGDLEASRLDGRICSEDAPETGSGISALLQGRSSASGGEDCDRTGWWESFLTYSSGAGPEERRASALLRVESVEIEELACAEPVYNLRVSGHPSYFANGILVHNCHVSYEALYKILDGPVWADKIVIGLSATPWARNMAAHWTKLIIGATIKDLIDEKILCGFRIYAPSEDADLSHVHIVKGEFDEGESSAAMREARIVADVVKTWQERWNQDRTFMFCVDRAHAREQQGKFEQAGIPFGYIDGTMSMDERRPVFQAFRTGSIKGIASVGCLSRGVDEDVHCIVDAQPTCSEMAFVQKIGRGLRNPNGDGKELLILDHAGNTLRLGMVTDIHHDTLDARKPGSKEKPFSSEGKKKKPHKCPHCNAIIPYGRAKCPVCGAVLKVPSRHEHQDGELVEFSLDKPAPRPREQMSDEQAFYSGLLDFARRRGWKDGWAAHKFQEKYGRWPNGLKVEAHTPRKVVKEFIRESAKAYRQQHKPAKAVESSPSVEAYSGEF